MEAQMKELIAYRDRRFAPPPTRLVALIEPKAPRTAPATESAIPAHAVAGERTAQPDARGGLRPGDLLHAVLQTAIHSDEPGPVRARVVGERFRDAILLGSLEKLPAPVGSRPERVLVRFRSLTLPTGATATLDAYAVDPATGRTALATDVDHHYAARWGALIAASFLEGYGQAVTSRHRIVTVGPFGNVISVPGDGISHDQIAREALGTVGARLGEAVGQQFNRPNTIRVDAGTAIGVLVVSAAPPTGAPALRLLEAPVEAGQPGWVPPPIPSPSESNP
jgi:intracellular multiplication protein IcmE